MLDDRGHAAQQIAKTKYDVEKPEDYVTIYASDEILLEGLVRKHWGKLIKNGEKYCDKFFPERKLSYEEYGIVVYDSGKYSKLYNYINDYINRKLKDNQGKDLEQWLIEDSDWKDQGMRLGRGNNTESRPEELISCWKKDN